MRPAGTVARGPGRVPLVETVPRTFDADLNLSKETLRHARLRILKGPGQCLDGRPLPWGFLPTPSPQEWVDAYAESLERARAEYRRERDIRDEYSARRESLAQSVADIGYRPTRDAEHPAKVEFEARHGLAHPIPPQGRPDRRYPVPPLATWCTRAESRRVRKARERWQDLARQESTALRDNTRAFRRDLPPAPPPVDWDDATRARYGALGGVRPGEDSDELMELLRASGGRKDFSAPEPATVRCVRGHKVARVLRLTPEFIREGGEAELDDELDAPGPNRHYWTVLAPYRPKGGHWVDLVTPADGGAPVVDMRGLEVVTLDWQRQSGRAAGERVTLPCRCGSVSVGRQAVARALDAFRNTGRTQNVRALPGGRKRLGQGADTVKGRRR